MRKVVTVFFITIAVFLFVFVGVNSFAHSNRDKYEELNKIEQQLGYSSSIDICRITSWSIGDLSYKLRIGWTPPSVEEQIESLKEEEESIEKRYEAAIDEYVSAISEYEFAQDIDAPNELDFIDKKEPEKIIQNLKVQFRDELIKYNETAEEPLRWKIDPEVELKGMTLEQKVGQLFMFAYTGTELSTEELAFIEENNIGGFTIFGDNVLFESQLVELTEEVRNLNPVIEPIVAVDQEGGLVKRITWDDTGSHKEIAQLDEQGQCNAWKKRSTLLRDLGLYWNLGIVADVSQDETSFIYPRTFSENYAEAAESVQIATNCSEGTITTLKHWPGHGATHVDTHQQLGELDMQNKEVWNKTDNLPFKATENADSIMVGHLLTPWLNPEVPASLSEEHINYLRDDIDFSGLVVTDDLMMLTQSGYTIEDVTRKALLAGNDVLFVVNNDLGIQEKLIDIGVSLVEEGLLEEEDLEERVSRIIEKKNRVVESDVESNLVY